MILRVNEKDYTIEDSWYGMTYARFKEVVEACELPVIERLNKLTNIPISELNQLTLKQLAFICDATQFMEYYEEALLFVKGYKDDLMIGRKTYGQLEQAKTFLQYKKPLLALTEIVELYYGENINDTPFVDSMGRGLELISKIDLFLKGFPELYEYEPTAEEIEAGVEDLSALGSFYTVKKISEKYQKHPDEILKWEAAVAYSILKADAIESRINRNLQKIAMRKKK